MKYACYCMTRNIYPKVIPSLKSLLLHSDVDKVYLVIEDNDIGIDIPQNVQCVNVSGQRFFPPDGANYHTHWTYMVMMRIALCYLFPDVHKILSLDLDTIIQEDISDVWDNPIDEMYCAAVEESPTSQNRGYPYFNAGVVLWNLDKMRDGKANEMISKLNQKHYDFVEQDCMNECCRGKIYHLASEYNANHFTSFQRGIKIRHFAAEPGWFSQKTVKEYEHIPWEQCTYKNGGR